MMKRAAESGWPALRNFWRVWRFLCSVFGVGVIDVAGVGMGAGGYCYGLERGDQVEGLAFVEETLEALEVIVIEGIVDIFLEVEAQLFFGKMHFGGGFGGDLGDLGEAEIAGGLKVGG